jgi:hypothetical protein
MTALDDVMRVTSDVQAGATWRAKEYSRNKSNLAPLIVGFVGCFRLGCHGVSLADWALAGIAASLAEFG